MDIGNFAMPLLENIGNKSFHSVNVIGYYSNPTIKYMVNGYYRDF